MVDGSLSARPVIKSARISGDIRHGLTRARRRSGSGPPPAAAARREGDADGGREPERAAGHKSHDKRRHGRDHPGGSARPGGVAHAAQGAAQRVGLLRHSSERNVTAPKSLVSAPVGRSTGQL